ncbi:MAG: hypothetical protein H6R18_1480 [Proteobacteria bacterium]|nr:hypothetical protein [Pseudomonadota bacterium]
MFVKSVVAALFLTFASSSCFANQEGVQWLRNQAFNKCKQFYVWRVVDNYIQGATWRDGGFNSNGDWLVNVVGRINYQNRPSKLVMQFTIDPKSRKFNMNGLWINGDAQSQDMRNALVANMCNNLK